MDEEGKQGIDRIVLAVNRLKDFKIEYPTDSNTEEEQLAFIAGKLKEMEGLLLGLDCTAVEKKWKYGRLAIEMKELSRALKNSFKKEFEARVSSFSFRTAERRMKLAEFADLDKCPAQVVLGQTRILKLSTFLTKGQKLSDFLIEHQIEIDINVTSKEKIRELICAVDYLLENKKKTRKKGVNSDKANPNAGKTIECFSVKWEKSTSEFNNLLTDIIRSGEIENRNEIKNAINVLDEIVKNIAELKKLL